MNVKMKCLNVSPLSQCNTRKLRHKSSRNRSRSWCFTINNYTEENYVSMSQPKNWPGKILKLIFQEEIGEKNTMHLQGWVKFENQLEFSVLKKYLPTAHIEKARSDKASIKYCSKTATASGRLYTYGILDAELAKPTYVPLSQDQILLDLRTLALEDSDFNKEIADIMIQPWEEDIALYEIEQMKKKGWIPY